jgi:hypothetical protein
MAANDDASCLAEGRLFSTTATLFLSLHRLHTRMARQRRLCSSITLRNLSLRPSALAYVALGAEVLTHHPAGQAF